MSTSNTLLRLSALAAAGVFAISAGLHAQLPAGESPSISFPAPGSAYISPGALSARTTKGEGRALLAEGVPTKQYSHGDPTNDEQYMLELVNRARANPTAEGEMLASVSDPEISSAYTYFNISREKLRNDFKTYPQRPPLAFNKSLIDAARNHGRDMDRNNFQGHVGSNGSTVGERMLAAGYGDGNYYGENVAAYSKSVMYGHVGLNVDWGEQNQIDLGHRKNIMNFAEFQYTEIGIGIIQNGQNGGQHTGPYIITQDFGRHSSPFVLGVVYQDKNGNNFYDQGEGMPGVRITPSSGDYYAITSASGGYAIPAPRNGSWAVTAEGGGLSSPITLNVALSGDNVKLDFRPGMSGSMLPVVLSQPAANAVIGTDTVKLSWESAQGASSYHLQVSTDFNFTNDIIVDDSTLSGASYTMRDLQNLSYYYWRVRAKGATGWSIFGEKRLFETRMAPAQVMLLSPANGAQVTAGSKEFQWNPGSSEVDRYWFEIATDPGMTAIVKSDSTIPDTWWRVNLENGQTYYWHVKAGSSAGWGEFSPVWSVSAGTSGVTGAAANSAFKLSANTPNPFSGSTTIGFELAGAGEISLRVLNGLGQEVATLAEGRFSAGAHEIRFDAAGMESGVYYYQLRANGLTETRSMIVTK